MPFFDQLIIKNEFSCRKDHACFNKTNQIPWLNQVTRKGNKPLPKKWDFSLQMPDSEKLYFPDHSGQSHPVIVCVTQYSTVFDYSPLLQGNCNMSLSPLTCTHHSRWELFPFLSTSPSHGGKVYAMHLNVVPQVLPHSTVSVMEWMNRLVTSWMLIFYSACLIHIIYKSLTSDSDILFTF